MGHADWWIMQSCIKCTKHRNLCLSVTSWDPYMPKSTTLETWSFIMYWITCGISCDLSHCSLMKHITSAFLLGLQNKWFVCFLHEVLGIRSASFIKSSEFRLLFMKFVSGGYISVLLFFLSLKIFFEVLMLTDCMRCGRRWSLLQQ